MKNPVSEDRLLIKRLLRGDEGAFTGFFDDQFPRIYRFALARTQGDHDVAEEVAQETLCRAMEKLKHWRGEAALTSWLFTICRNLISDRYRGPAGKTRSFAMAEDFPEVQAALDSLQTADNANPESHGLLAELRVSVQTALDYLPAHQATALRMKYFEGVSVRELSIHLNLTEKAAESLLSRARRSFREAFAEISSLANTLSQESTS
ncbi:MAG: RNA polymerase sigma factor [Lysobacterales bacterium]